MQGTEFLIPLLHSPMAKEQCPPLIHHQPSWGRERQQQRGFAGHHVSLSSLPWPMTVNNPEHSCGSPYLFPCMMPLEQKASQQRALWPHDLCRTSCSALGWKGPSLLSKGSSVLQEMAFLVLRPVLSMWRPFTTRNECLMFKICSEDCI